MPLPNLLWNDNACQVLQTIRQNYEKAQIYCRQIFALPTFEKNLNNPISECNIKHLKCIKKQTLKLTKLTSPRRRITGGKI